MYSINIGDFTANESVYPNRCLSASIGGNGIASDVIPWDGTDYNPWDYKYEDGEFVLDAIVINVVPEIPEPSIESRIDDLEIALCELFETLM